MAATVFYQGSSEIAVLGNTFTVAGVVTDPGTVSVVVTDPTGAQVTHTYLGAAPADISKISTGVYSLQIPCVLPGLWSYVWIGTGAVSDVTAGTFTVTPVLLGRWYTSKEEVKSRMGLDPTDTQDDDQFALAVAGATRAIEQFTHRYFWQGSDTRKYMSDSIEITYTDDLVSVTALTVDTTGNGVYDQTWGVSDFKLEPVNAPGFAPEPKPYTTIRALPAGGGHFWFPWTYPLSNPYRVQVNGVFGWPQVPPLVNQAAIQLATDIYKMKDAPFGIMGSAEFGVIRIRQSPQIEEYLWHYVRGSKKVGV